MFTINDDLSIYITRGDAASFSVMAEINGAAYEFKPTDVVRISVFEKKNCEAVVLQKDFAVSETSDRVDISLTSADTKIGGIISKPTDYWYEVVLNPFTEPQTIIGYDDDGAKIFKLFPEGEDITEDIEEEDIPIVDSELSLTSRRPVENQAVARKVLELEGTFEKEFDELYKNVSEKTDRCAKEVGDALSELKIGGYVKGIKEQNDGDVFSVWVGTEEEYSEITKEGTPAKNRLYLIEDEPEVADYIVEQGTQGDWTYRKWNSGVAECWGHKTFHTDVEYLLGQGVYRSGVLTQALPVGLFTSIANSNLEVIRNKSVAYMGRMSKVDTSTIEFYVLRIDGTASEGNDTTFSCNFSIKGRWKDEV